jgi:hypothetical protein
MPWGFCVRHQPKPRGPKVGHPDRGDRSKAKAGRKANRKRR